MSEKAFFVLIAILTACFSVAGYFIGSATLSFVKTQTEFVTSKDVIGYRVGIPVFFTVAGFAISMHIASWIDKLMEKRKSK